MIAPACGRADGVFSEQYAIFLQKKKKKKKKPWICYSYNFFRQIFWLLSLYKNV